MNARDQLMELRRTWKAPDGMDHSRPREVTFTSSGKALVVLSVVLAVGALAAAIGLGLVAVRQAKEARLLQDEGVVTDGTITRLWRGRDDKKQPWMTYRFMSRTGSHERNAKVSLSAWRALRVGSQVPVRYIPSQPGINRPAGARGGILPLWVPFVVGGVLAAFAFLPTLPLRGQRRLLAEGRLVPGLVTRHGKPERGQHGNKLGRKYYYEFVLLDGALADGKVGPVKNPPEVGSTISVLYDPEKPRSNAPYPLSLVMPASLQSFMRMKIGIPF